jgi:hypothetical protein
LGAGNFKNTKSNGRGHMESSIRFLCNSPPSSARSCYVQGNPKGEESIASSLTSSSSSSFDGKETETLGRCAAAVCLVEKVARTLVPGEIKFKKRRKKKREERDHCTVSGLFRHAHTHRVGNDHPPRSRRVQASERKNKTN